jgi:hypothetical protein
MPGRQTRVKRSTTFPPVPRHISDTLDTHAPRSTNVALDLGAYVGAQTGAYFGNRICRIAGAPVSP